MQDAQHPPGTVIIAEPHIAIPGIAILGAGHILEGDAAEGLLGALHGEGGGHGGVAVGDGEVEEVALVAGDAEVRDGPERVGVRGLGSRGLAGCEGGCGESAGDGRGGDEDLGKHYELLNGFRILYCASSDCSRGFERWKS